MLCPCAATGKYIIKNGDTLWDLSQMWGTTVNVLMEMNPGVVPEQLHVGQVINRPSLLPTSNPRPSVEPAPGAPGDGHSII